MDRVGPYEVRGTIGRGGMGLVVRGWDPRLNREVAIKVLNTSGATDAQRERFRREATAQARLRHPHIAAVHDVGEHERQAYIVMDLVQGESLEARLARGDPLAPRVAADLVRKLARAVAHAHENGILHRDLKPANVLLTSDLEPVLVDFGLAKHLGGNSASLSRHGAFLGTPGYWPPEQASGQLDKIGPPADVYGLGALLYACLTGRPPHVGDTLIEVLVAARQRAEPPSAVRAGIPPDLDAVCLRCLEKGPDDRYHSAWELAEDLEAFVRGDRLRVRPAKAGSAGALPDVVTPVVGRSRRTLLAAAAGVGALAVTLVAVVVAVRRAGHDASLPDAELAAIGATLERDRGPAALDAVAPVPSRAATDPTVSDATRAALVRLRLQAQVVAAVSGDEAATTAVNAALAAQFGDPYALEADLFRIEALRRTGDLTGAAAWLSAAAARHPDEPSLVHRRGLLNLERLQFAAARDDLQKVFADGGALEVGLDLGRALVGAGEHAAALDHLRALAAKGAPSADAWTALGEAALVAGDPLELLPDSRQHLDEAARALDRALGLDGSHVGALLARARLRHATGLAALGRQDAERGRELLASGEHRGAWLDAVVTSALLSLQLGDLDAAQARYEEALEAAPDTAPALAGLGHVALKRGSTTRGAALLARARAARLDPAASSEASRLLRAATERHVRRDTANQLLSRAARLDPFFSEALLERANCQGAPERATARRLLERAIAVDPTSARARERLGCVLEGAREVGAAAVAFQSSHELARTPLERARALRGLAATRTTLGELDEATSALDAAQLALAAHGVPDLETLPIALACEALRASVCTVWEDATGLAAARAREHELRALASALAREGLRAAELLRAGLAYADAIARLDQVIALEPGIAAAWFARGECYLKIGNFVPGILDVVEAGRLDPFLVDPEIGKVYQLSYVVDLRRVKAEIQRTVADAPDEARAAALAPAFALGKCEFKKYDLADVAEGLAGADRTLELDPRFVLALDTRAVLRLKRTLLDPQSPGERLLDLDAAERDIARALELTPRLVFTHFVAASLAARRAACGPAAGAGAAKALAITRLARAVELGFQGHLRLRSDRLFDVLRGAPEFERLVTELEVRYPTPVEKPEADEADEADEDDEDE